VIAMAIMRNVRLVKLRKLITRLRRRLLEVFKVEGNLLSMAGIEASFVNHLTQTDD
jgi:hypothetical protein